MSMLQVNQLKDVVAKKEAEIAGLHKTEAERLEKAENAENTDKSKPGKPTNASKPRRHTRTEPQPPKNRKTTVENGNANAEVCLISSRFNVLCMPLYWSSSYIYALLVSGANWISMPLKRLPQQSIPLVPMKSVNVIMPSCEF